MAFRPLSPKVRWCTVDGTTADVDPALFEGIEVTFVGPSELSASGADVVILDAHAFTDVEELLLARRGTQAPVLVRVAARGAEPLLSALPESDEICIFETPPRVLARRVRQLVSRAAEALDTLTGALNRHVLMRGLEARLRDASASRPISVLIVDVDLFKAINDEYGHGVGDDVLREVARRTAQAAGSHAAVGRLGGEEFCVVLECDERAAVDVAQAVRSGIGDALMPMALHVTVSVGVATAWHPETTSELLRRADEALYAAKAHGRDRAVHYADLEREAMRADQDVGLSSFENLTRVISEQVAQVIAQRGRRLFRELRHEADVDGLTSLFNRRYLDRRLIWELEESARSGAPLALALVDVDYFGNVNKEHGWPTGDRVLREIAAVVKERVAPCGWAARYGGEELCLVMPGTTASEARTLLEEIRLDIAKRRFAAASGKPLQLTVSAGVDERRPGDATTGDLVARVSDRLLEAKRGGRNQVR